MPDYRRAWVPGGTWFFTVNLLERHDNDLLVRHIDRLRDAVRDTRRHHPFTIHGFVVLPDHLHAVLELPAGDTDFALRWRRIKALFSKSLPTTEFRSTVRQRRGERGIWQRRYWEHLIRDEADYRAHIDYVHVNPLKHGLVTRVQDWPHSTFHKYVEAGVYPPDWCGDARADGLDYLD
ncbi:MAG: REP-associated tyrosine transposase [Permianibacter sp.]